MAAIKEYHGRRFVESDFYQPIERHIVGMSCNHVWLYTVDKAHELSRESGEFSDKVIVRIVRWRARNDPDNKNKKYWRFPRAYNIRSAEEWNTTSQIVDSIIDDSSEKANFVVIPTEKYKELLGGKKEILELNRRLRKVKELKSATALELNSFKRRVKLMKAHVKEYKNHLKDFKKLVDDSNSTESMIHQFIIDSKAFWMFGLEYVDIKSKVRFPPGENTHEFDLMLQRHDSFWDLVELKGPNETLFDRRTTHRNKPNVKLSEAIGQVFTYLHLCDTVGLGRIVKPKAIIVLGKEQTDNLKERRIFSSYLNNVDLMTYTDLYRQGNNLLNYIRQ